MGGPKFIGAMSLGIVKPCLSSLFLCHHWWYNYSLLTLWYRATIHCSHQNWSTQYLPNHDLNEPFLFKVSCLRYFVVVTQSPVEQSSYNQNRSIVTIWIPLVLSTQHEQEVFYLYNAVVGTVVRHNWNQEKRTCKTFQYLNLPAMYFTNVYKTWDSVNRQPHGYPQLLWVRHPGSVVCSRQFQAQPLLINFASCYSTN